MSYRIVVSEIDGSRTVKTEAGVTGAMVIRAPKGPMKPVLIYPGDEARIKRLFGAPSPAYPDAWEAIQFNKLFPIWISAPFDAATDKLHAVKFASAGVTGVNDGILSTALEGFTFSGATEYFVLALVAPSASAEFSVEASMADTKIWTVKLLNKTTEEVLKTYVFSLDPAAKDGFGKSIYLMEVLENDDYLQAYINPTASVTTFVGTTDPINVVGGSRTVSLTSAELKDGWAYFKQFRKYPAQIMMDPTADDEIPATFNDLREGFQKYADYIFPIPMGEPSADAITLKGAMSLSNRGLKCYWNHGKVKYNNQVFWTSLVGKVGIKYAQMANVFNGLAPSWIDENKHGGELGPGIIEMEYDPSETELQALDDAGINPIIFHPDYGVILASQRTCSNPAVISDDSWIGHSRLFDYIIKNIMEQVLTFQITKLNDDQHRIMATVGANTILSPIKNREHLLNDYLVKCDGDNNNAEARAQRQFVFTLGVQVTPFSEWIYFNFVKVGQQFTVTEMIG